MVMDLKQIMIKIGDEASKQEKGTDKIDRR